MAERLTSRLSVHGRSAGQSLHIPFRNLSRSNDDVATTRKCGRTHHEAYMQREERYVDALLLLLVVVLLLLLVVVVVRTLPAWFAC